MQAETCFLSGSEIGWDLDRPDGATAVNPTAADRAFFHNTLGAAYSADDANTYTSVVTAGGIFTGISSFAFSNGHSLFRNSIRSTKTLLIQTY